MTYIAKHNIHPNSAPPRSIAHDIGGHIPITQRPERVSATRYNKRRTISYQSIIDIRGEEHDIPDHDKRGGDDEEDNPPIKAPR